MSGHRRLDWAREGADWPNRDASRFIDAGAYLWHVQVMGQGPVLLLLHGTAASTHSFRDCLTVLARTFRVVAPDLPGHAFTRAVRRGDPSLRGMAAALGDLLKALDLSPDIAVGHSAGAAILARMSLDRLIAPKLIVGLNGAFMPFDGWAGRLFPPMAKVLFLNPFAPRLFAASADRFAVERLLRGTGSTIDRRGVDLYARLFSNTAHVEGALAMMANWDLAELARDIVTLAPPLTLVVGRKDKAVPPQSAARLQALVAGATTVEVGGVGHLAHEERPAEICALVSTLAAPYLAS